MGWQSWYNDTSTEKDVYVQPFCGTNMSYLNICGLLMLLLNIHFTLDKLIEVQTHL